MALQLLSAKPGIRLEDLQDDPKFVDTVLHATQIALRNAQSEKRSALRNAIVNSGLATAPDESRRQMFLNFVDSFTVWHLRVLALFGDPTGWFLSHNVSWPSISMGARSHLLDRAFPEANQDSAFFRQVWRDLHTSGLVSLETLGGMVTGSGLSQPATTLLGNQFLAFITESP